MADIGIRSGKVRPGFYRCGAYCIHKGNNGWGVYAGPCFIGTHRTLTDAYLWCRQRPIAAAA